MKQLIAVLLLLAVCYPSFSQKDPMSQPEKVNYPIGIGPFIAFKSGVNANDVPSGIKNGVAFVPMPDFGVTAYIPFGEESKIGTAIDLAYSTYGFARKFTGDEDNPWTEKFSYLTLGPSVHIWGFLLGFNFGLPMSGTVGRSEAEVDTEDMAFMAEVRIGAMIPIVQSEFGRLNLILTGGYFLTGQAKEVAQGGFNTHPASLSLGLNYIFNLTSN